MFSVMISLNADDYALFSTWLILKAFLCLDIGLITANMLLELQQLSRELNLSLEEVLGIHVVGRGVAAVLLDVETDGSA